MDIETMRADAAEIMAEIRAVEATLKELRLEHAELAQSIELESRKQAKVSYIPRGVSGKVKPSKRPLDLNTFATQFANLLPEVQAKVMAELRATI